jgi:hypothetical protein
MSHIAWVKSAVTDLSVVQEVASQHGYSFDASCKTHKIFMSQVEGSALHLPGWTYPIVIQPNGDLAYDHYNGLWGNPDHLQTFLHEYTTMSVLKNLQAAGIAGYVVSSERAQSGQLLTRIRMA